MTLSKITYDPRRYLYSATELLKPNLPRGFEKGPFRKKEGSRFYDVVNSEDHSVAMNADEFAADALVEALNKRFLSADSSFEDEILVRLTPGDLRSIVFLMNGHRVNPVTGVLVNQQLLSQMENALSGIEERQAAEENQ